MTMLDDSQLTDPGLVAEVRLGRREAFGELYRRYYSGALRYALSMTRGDETRAQDIVSEAFTRVFRAVSRDGSISAFWPYLLTSVRNAYRAELRRSGRVDLVERATDLDGLVPEAPTAADHDPSIRAAFHRLPPRWQSVLWRSEICGDTAAEIGHDLGISANAAAALAFRAREGLRVEYLRTHFTNARAECRPYAEQIPKLVRGVLGRRERRRVEAHVRICDECARALADLTSLNGRMRSVMPLILGVVPFASGHGVSSAPVGAVGSGLVGSAGVASGAVSAAGVTGGAAGAAGLAGVGAVGVSHVTAVAGLAVASMVAMLGLPAEPSGGDPAESPPAQTATVLPEDAATTADDPAASLAESLVDDGEVALSEDLPAESDPVNSPPDVPVPVGEAGTVTGAEASDAGTDGTSESEPADAMTDTTADGAGSAAEDTMSGNPGGNGVGSDEAGAQPFGTGVPASPQGQGAGNWAWGDDEYPGPGQSAASDGTKKGPGEPATGDGAGRGEPAKGGSARNDPPQEKPEEAAEPTRDGPARPARPSQAAEPTRQGPAQPARPTQKAEPNRPSPDATGKPAQGVESTAPGRSSRHRRSRWAPTRRLP